MNEASARHEIFDPSSARPARYRGWGFEFIRWLAIAYLKLARWRMEGDWPGDEKAILLAAPHTSNWDGLNMLAVAVYYRVPLKWMGKASLARPPFGPFMRWAGLMPVDRSGGLDIVQQAADFIAASDETILAVAPEGTRAANPKWKTGYYHIAVRAGIPIIFSVLDYGARRVRLAGRLWPSGDYEADRKLILSHYKTAQGKKPDLFVLDA